MNESGWCPRRLDRAKAMACCIGVAADISSGCGRPRHAAPLRPNAEDTFSSSFWSLSSQCPSTTKITSPRACWMPIFRAALESRFGLLKSRMRGCFAAILCTSQAVSSVDSPSTTMISHSPGYSCSNNCRRVDSICRPSFRTGTMMLIDRKSIVVQVEVHAAVSVKMVVVTGCLLNYVTVSWAENYSDTHRVPVMLWTAKLTLLLSLLRALKHCIKAKALRPLLVKSRFAVVLPALLEAVRMGRPRAADRAFPGFDEGCCSAGTATSKGHANEADSDPLPRDVCKTSTIAVVFPIAASTTE
jgi:hypothetical protein